MLASSSTVAPKPAAAMPPAAQPSLPATSAGSAPQFAQFLTSQASPPAPPAHTDPEPDSQPEAAAPAAAAPRRATAQPAKPAAQKPAGEATAKADAKAACTDKADTAKTTDAATTAVDEDDTAETPELKEFTQLIGMNTAQPDPAAAVARPELHRGRVTATDDDAGQARNPLQATGDKGRATDKPEAAAAKPADLRSAADKAAAQAGTEQPQATSALQAGKDQLAAAAPAPTAAPSFAAALAQALPPPTALPDAAPAATYAAVQAPLHTDAFASEIGARVSLLAVDGVQQAELQLNPADMGPVSVQITVDGNQAQVSFHAVQAETRAALEQSLPDLAAALQGQGLTLSGGGVFQQAPRDADHGDERSGNAGTARNSRGGGDRVGGTADVAAAPARRTVGLLDTFV